MKLSSRMDNKSLVYQVDITRTTKCDKENDIQKRKSYI